MFAAFRGAIRSIRGLAKIGVDLFPEAEPGRAPLGRGRS